MCQLEQVIPDNGPPERLEQSLLQMNLSQLLMAYLFGPICLFISSRSHSVFKGDGVGVELWVEHRVCNDAGVIHIGSIIAFTMCMAK